MFRERRKQRILGTAVIPTFLLLPVVFNLMTKHCKKITRNRYSLAQIEDRRAGIQSDQYKIELTVAMNNSGR